MNGPVLGNFLESLRWQSEPLWAKTKQQRRTAPGTGPAGLDRKMGGALAAVFGQERPVQQLCAGAGIDRTIAAMNEFRQLGATAVAIDADFRPARVERLSGGWKRLRIGAQEGKVES